MLTSPKLAIGIDVGGSSIKGALVDLDSGKFASDRFSTPTPAQDSTETLLQALADVVANMPGAHRGGSRVSERHPGRHRTYGGAS